MASRLHRSSPMEASRRPSSLMLSPASIRMRVFSVASRAAFPELPLARTQNLTVAASLATPEYTESPLDAETQRRGEFKEKKARIDASLLLSLSCFSLTEFLCVSA